LVDSSGDPVKACPTTAPVAASAAAPNPSPPVSEDGTSSIDASGGYATQIVWHSEQRTFDPVAFSKVSSSLKLVLHFWQVRIMTHPNGYNFR
jgi:hypothetical protein